MLASLISFIKSLRLLEEEELLIGGRFFLARRIDIDFNTVISSYPLSAHTWSQRQGHQCFLSKQNLKLFSMAPSSRLLYWFLWLHFNFERDYPAVEYTFSARFYLVGVSQPFKVEKPQMPLKMNV